MSVQYSRRPFTVAEFDQMAEAGILREDDRVELIEGEIVAMSPIGREHAACVRKLTRVLARLLGDRTQISVQNPVTIPDWTQPNPDVALLVPRADYYADAHPTPRQVQVIIEVADTTLAYDTQVKAALYAGARVREMWVIDLKARRLVVHAQPQGKRYARVQSYSEGEHITSRRFPGIRFAVNDLLP